MSFAACVEPLLIKEGGYVNDPNDSGGETIWGITVAVARAFGYSGDMRSMTKDQARQIYRARYWDSMLLDRVAEMSPEIADELFDSGVNCGVAKAGTWLQRVLNVLNQGGAMYKDIAADGRVGPMTIAALREFLARRGANGARVVFRALNSLQGTHYITLAEDRAKDEAFVYGWLLNRVA